MFGASGHRQLTPALGVHSTFYHFLLLARSGPCILTLGEGLAGLQLIGKHSGEAGDLVPVQAASWSLRGHWLLYDSLVEQRKHGALLMPFRREFSEEICFCLASSRCSERSQAVGILRMYEFRFLAVRLCPCGSKEVVSQPLFVEADK